MKILEPTCLGICGPSGVGKTTLAKALIECNKNENNFTLLPINEPVYKVAYSFALACGMNVNTAADFFIYKNRSGQHEPREEFLGRSVRQILQKIGTEFGREQVHPDIWVSAWKKRARFKIEQGDIPINDSVRFQNEIDAIHELGGIVVRLDWTENFSLPETTHQSETTKLEGIEKAYFYQPDRVSANVFATKIIEEFFF